MKRTLWILAGLAVLALLLVGGAFMGGRLLGSGLGPLGADEGPKVQIGNVDGQTIEAEWARSEELPESSPDVAGAFSRRQDNSIFVDQTTGGFVLASNDDGSLSVSNATGQISEVVVVAETVVHADVTLEHMDQALSDGVLHQKLEPGTLEEIGELSFVRAWGEMHGDRLIAAILVYSRPPVISR